MAEWKAMGWSVIGWSFGGLAVLAVAAVIGAWLEKKYPGEGCDERQKLIRGEAYRFSFWVGLLLDAGLYFWLRYGFDFELGTETVLFVGVQIQIVAFHLYCLVKRMELPLARRSRWTAAVYGLIAVMNFRNFFGNLEYAEAYDAYSKIYPDTTLTPGVVGEDTYLMLVAGVAFAALAAIHLIQYFWERREAE